MQKKESALKSFDQAIELRPDYKIALNMFLEKPLVGHGTKIFRHYCAKPENFVSGNACTTHPHNILMQFLAETGLIGTIFYILVIYFLIKYLLNNFYFWYYL